MSDKKRLLEVRKAIKSKKPEFNQQDSHKKVRVAKKWRRPRGLQSKMRHQFKGYSRLVKQGWRSPVEVRGTLPSGDAPLIVHNVNEVSKLKSNTGVLIAKTVGNKKRLEMIHKAEELKIRVLNIKVDKFKTTMANTMADKKKIKAVKQEKKKKSIEEAVKKSEKDKEKKEKVAAAVDKQSDESVEDKKAEDKKNKDNVIIHKD